MGVPGGTYCDPSAKDLEDRVPEGVKVGTKGSGDHPVPCEATRTPSRPIVAPEGTVTESAPG